MPQPPGTLYEIRWNEICPWLILVRALRVSIMVRVLVLACIGVLLTQWGWSAIDSLFAENGANLEQLTDHQAERMLRVPTLESLTGDAGPMVRAWSWLAQPLLLLTRHETTWQRSLALALSGIWAIVVWALLGGAITRIAAMHLTRGETIGPLTALRASLAKWGATAGAPLIALLGIAALAMPMLLDGFLLRLDAFAMLAGIFWVLLLAWGMLLAIVSLGLLLGWPLMWATVGVERTDAFDSVSRCYAYIYQRPLHLAFYLLVAICLDFLGEAVVCYFAAAAVVLSEWTISWGAGSERVAELVARPPSDLSTTVAIGARAVQFWKWTLSALVASFSVGYLWSASVGIYLLLRRQVDSIELEEIAFDVVEPQDGLPELKPGESGVPQVDGEMTNDE